MKINPFRVVIAITATLFFVALLHALWTESFNHTDYGVDKLPTGLHGPDGQAITTKYRYIVIKTGDNRTIEIGLRSDHVVVWREVPSP